MIAATLRYVPESKAPRPRRVDVPGQLLMIALLGSLTYAVIQGPGSGWTAVPVLAAGALAVLAARPAMSSRRRARTRRPARWRGSRPRSRPTGPSLPRPRAGKPPRGGAGLAARGQPASSASSRASSSGARPSRSGPPRARSQARVSRIVSVTDR
jgi:hypothetical protein